MSYTQLWDQFLEETAQLQAGKAGLVEQLGDWHDWAHMQRENDRLSDQQVEHCYGPKGAAEVYDRALVGDVAFTCTRLEEN